MDTLNLSTDNSSVSFFVCLAGISFGIAGFCGAIDIIRQVQGRAQETHYLNSILLLTGLIIIFSLSPLVLDGTSFGLAYSGYGLTASMAALFLQQTYYVCSKKVAVQNPFIFIVAFFFSVCFLILITVNSAYWQKLWIYKMFLLWATVLALLRFALFIQHVSKSKNVIKNS